MVPVLRIRIDRMRILNIWSMQILSGSGSLTIKIISPNFSKHIYSISLISKLKILLILKHEPNPYRLALIRRMSAINVINLSRFVLYFIPQDPDPRTQKNADPCGSGSATLNGTLYYPNIIKNR